MTKHPITVCYSRVSTGDQKTGLEAQHQALTDFATREGLDAQLVDDEGVSGGVHPDTRPGLGPVLAQLDREGGVLVAVRFDRIARSLADLATLLDRALARGWTIRVLDAAGLDLSTPMGRMVAGVLGSVAAFERDLIRARTREALAALKAQGVVLGRPKLMSHEIEAEIVSLRSGGLTFQGIADKLNAAGTLTPTGKCWNPSLVRKVVVRAA